MSDLSCRLNHRKIGKDCAWEDFTRELVPRDELTPTHTVTIPTILWTAYCSQYCQHVSWGRMAYHLGGHSQLPVTSQWHISYAKSSQDFMGTNSIVLVGLSES